MKQIFATASGYTVGGRLQAQVHPAAHANGLNPAEMETIMAIGADPMKRRMARGMLAAVEAGEEATPPEPEANGALRPTGVLGNGSKRAEGGPLRPPRGVLKEG